MNAEIELDRDDCRPFEALTGRIRWREGGRPEGFELRLFWMTRGRGTEEIGVVANLDLDLDGSGSEIPFRFELPGAPYSCSGTLVSIVWAVELVAPEGEAIALREFVLSPTRVELEMREVEAPRSNPKRRFGGSRRRS